jgi:hypothetical protein
VKQARCDAGAIKPATGGTRALGLRISVDRENAKRQTIFS